MYKTVSIYSGSLILGKQLLKFPILIVLDLTAAENAEFFVGKYLRISQKSHGGGENMLRYVKKSTLTEKLFFTPIPTSIVHISQNKPV